MSLKEIYYKGKDGNQYPDSASLAEADTAWGEVNFRPIERTPVF